MGNGINVDNRDHTLICRTKLRKKCRKFWIMLKKFTLIGLLLNFTVLILCAQAQKFTFETGKMGSPFRIVVSTQDSTGLAKKIKKAFALADDLENQLSDYRENSVVSQINRLAGTGKYFPISSDFKSILLESISAQKMTGGSLNVFAGKMVKAWRKARQGKQLPDSLLMAEVSRNIQGECVQFSKDSSEIRLVNSFCQLDFGSIGKGFVAQKVMDFLVSLSCPYVLVDAGGKIVCTQINESGDVWKVGLELPQSKNVAPSFLKVQNTSVATSGKTYQFAEINGKEYSHVLNPLTGWALTHAKSATVVIKNGAVSDWLATAATIVEIEKLKEIISYFKDVKILVWQNNSGKLEVVFNHNVL
jgi:thiamine biosynthesis lipoprotein